MRRIYLDNASTSWPKAPMIAKTMSDYLEGNGSNLGRGDYDSSYRTEEQVLSVREKVASLFHTNHSECVAFTPNITTALNWAIKGLFQKGDHVLISSQEHNSVMRPLVQCGIAFTRIPTSVDGIMLPLDLEKLLQPHTKGIVLSAASNVSGAIQNTEGIAQFAKSHHLLFVLDTAQALPYLDYSFPDLHASVITFTGHKGLLGPQGIGGMLLDSDSALTIDPLVSGGTGSASDSLLIPSFLPDRLEAGTPNIPGILALGTALDYLAEKKDDLLKSEMTVTEELLEGLKEIDGIRIVGPQTMEGRVPVISIDVEGKDNADIAFSLSDRYGIETRVGLHCAPEAHRLLHTFPKGTIRFSPGPYTKSEDIEETLKALKEVLHD